MFGTVAALTSQLHPRPAVAAFPTVDGAHRYWRLVARATGTEIGSGNGPDNYATIAEVVFRETSGGADIASLATMTGSTPIRSGEEADKAVDGNTSTFWQVIPGSGLDIRWLQFDFGIGVTKYCREIVVTPLSGFHSRCPQEISVQWSDDGSTWSTEWNITTTWGSATPQTFTKPDHTLGAYRRWRVNITDKIANSEAASASELEFRETVGGANALSGGTFTTLTQFGSVPGTYDPDKTQDLNTATLWSAVKPYYEWIAYDFGAGNETAIFEIAWRSRTGGIVNQNPKTVSCEASADGVNWLVHWTDSNATTWTDGEQREYS